ncbi:MAG: dienelactone hydrolase family protein [Kofleriaceae bacterium]
MLPIACAGRSGKPTAKVVGSRVDVRTGDGVADCYFAHPSSGRYPGILMWPDFMSLRPTYELLANRLVEAGYAVLVINQYYRDERSPFLEKADFDNKEVLTKIRTFSARLNAATSATDAKACAEFLDAHASVDPARKIGTFGFCMGGALALKSAAAVPQRYGAFGSFHGGLVSESADSAHLLIPQLRARALIAIAADDDAKDPNAKTQLRAAFSAAKLPAEIEVYEGTKHGWCTPDMEARYHPEQAQRAWGRLLTLFAQAL